LQQLSTAADESLKQLEPHFGSKIASQLLHQAASATQAAAQSAAANLPAPVALAEGVKLPPVSLPDLSSIHAPHVPHVQLPSVKVPAFDLHEVAVPDSHVVLETVTHSAEAAADSLAQLPVNLQQQLQLLQLQIQEQSTGSSSLEPHFGSQAVASLLQQLVEGFTSTVHQHLPVLQLPTSPPASWLSSQSQLLLADGSSNGDIDAGMFFYNSGGSAAAAAAAKSLKASWHVLQAAGQQALPEGAVEPIRQGVAAVTHWQEAASAASVANSLQLQQALLELQTQLLQLQQHGMGGYSFPTLCFVAAGAIAAVAASVPSDADDTDSIKDELSHEYDPEQVAAYFKRRPVLVAQRSMQLAAEIAGFGVNILLDLWSNRLQVSCSAMQ